MTLGCPDPWDLFLCPSLAKLPLPGFSKPCSHFLDSRAWLYPVLTPSIWNFKPQNANQGLLAPTSPFAQLLSVPSLSLGTAEWREAGW